MEKVMTHFELAFWNWYIPVFSQSSLVRKLIPWIYKLTRRAMITTYLVMALVLTSGFMSGILLFMISNH